MWIESARRFASTSPAARPERWVRLSTMRLTTWGDRRTNVPIGACCCSVWSTCWRNAMASQESPVVTCWRLCSGWAAGSTVSSSSRTRSVAWTLPRRRTRADGATCCPLWADGSRHAGDRGWTRPPTPATSTCRCRRRSSRTRLDSSPKRCTATATSRWCWRSCGMASTRPARSSGRSVCCSTSSGRGADRAPRPGTPPRPACCSTSVARVTTFVCTSSPPTAGAATSRKTTAATRCSPSARRRDVSSPMTGIASRPACVISRDSLSAGDYFTPITFRAA